jgi:hypothetical protein
MLNSFFLISVHYFIWGYMWMYNVIAILYCCRIKTHWMWINYCNWCKIVLISIRLRIPHARVFFKTEVYTNTLLLFCLKSEVQSQCLSNSIPFVDTTTLQENTTFNTIWSDIVNKISVYSYLIKMQLSLYCITSDLIKMQLSLYCITSDLHSKRLSLIADPINI